MRLIYEAPANYVLLPEGPKGPKVNGGKEFTVSEKRGTELLEQGLPVSPAPSFELTRPELDNLAAKVGVSDPESLPNKAAVEAAMEAAGSAEQEPAA